MKRAWKRNGYPGKPPTVNLNEVYRASVERDRDSTIKTGADLNKTIASWKRFNERTRPGSTKPTVLETGEIVPEYFVRERRNQVIQENRNRMKTKRNLYPNWEELDAVERAAAMANKNMHMEPKPDGWENPLDRMGKFGMMSRSDQAYSLRYTETLESLFSKDPELEEIAEIVEAISIANPQALREIFENPAYDDVTAISFLYDEGESPFLQPAEDYEFHGRKRKGRRTMVKEFWRKMADVYL